MAFTIEKNIVPQTRGYVRKFELPKQKTKRSGDKPVKRINSIYPFGDMEIGDSFIISDRYTRQLHQLYGNAARNFKNKSSDKHFWRFSVRKWNENQIRVWRVK